MRIRSERMRQMAWRHGKGKADGRWTDVWEEEGGKGRASESIKR